MSDVEYSWCQRAAPLAKWKVEMQVSKFGDKKSILLFYFYYFQKALYVLSNLQQ